MGKRNTKESIWKYIILRSPEDCWEWKGYKIGGYGRINVNYKAYLSHRIVYELTYGPIPEDMIVCHKCDNPSCCNPNHLFLGTDKDNMHDKYEKGRENIIKGEKHYNSKLKNYEILEIRKLYHTGDYTLKELGKIYSTSSENIWKIVKNINWKHI